jgi:hypothetical protein
VSASKKIRVTIPARIERIDWADHKVVYIDGRGDRLPMTKVIEIVEAEVLVEVDLPEIIAQIAQTALYNAGKKATMLNGNIRAKVLTVTSEEEIREPTNWKKYDEKEEDDDPEGA